MNVRQVSRSEIERVAYIIGGSSAAGAALRAADDHPGTVRFYLVKTRQGERWIVERVEQNTDKGQDA